MNISMWREALKRIPRVSKEQWEQMDILGRWLIATRSAVLVMTFLSAAMAGLFAYFDEAFHLGRWLMLTWGLLMAHATNNLLNDYTDYVKGVDKQNYYRAKYGTHPLEQGFMSARRHLLYAVATGVLALIPGAWFVYIYGAPALWLTLAGLVFVLFYTYPLKYVGLGEFAVLLVWGPLMIGGGYFVITGTWSWTAVLLSLPYALSTTLVIFGKHIDKIKQDREKGIYTVPVLLGERQARNLAMVFMGLQYLLVLVIVLLRALTPFVLLVFLAVPLLLSTVKIFNHPRPVECPDNYDKDAWPLWFVAYAFRHNKRYGLFFMLGLLAQALYQGFV
ncbi:MAG: prenyltransferase [Bacteroidota bacterium]